jgi:hypothetical protein
MPHEYDKGHYLTRVYFKIILILNDWDIRVNKDC